MVRDTKQKNHSSRLAMGGVLLCGLLAVLPAAAGPVAHAPYKLSLFATSQNGYSAPDSIVQWRDSVLVGFGNGIAKDGTDGKFSTIVQYSLSGKVKRIFSVQGHNDGLRLRPGTDDLWALQNEDANPNLVIIELNSGKQKAYTFAPTVHGGGFDDILFKNGDVFMTASNPNTPGGVNIFPALVRATLSGSAVNVEPVLNGNDNATDIPSGTVAPLNLSDPDSLTIDPRGNIVLDSQADNELVFIRHPLTAQQEVGSLLITSSGVLTTLDDTAFVPDSRAFLLFTDLSGNAIYRLDSPPFGFEPGVAYSASDTAGIIAVLDLDNGALTPIVTGLISPRGLLFIPPDDDDRGRGDEWR